MTTITIDIDKPYNDKNIDVAADKILSLGNEPWLTMDYRRSAHDRLHVDVIFPDNMYRRITQGFDINGKFDNSDIEDMYFILFRLAAGDDIRRLRIDARKFFKGEDIFHWLPSKDDYRKVAEGEK